MDTASNKVNLPVKNGSIEVGIAAGTDKSLALERKLELGKSHLGVAERTACAMVSARRVANASCPGNPVIELMMVCAAFGLCKADLCSLASKDVIEITPPDYSEAAFKEASDMIDSVDVGRAMGIVVATKLTWFATGHHTGGDALVGYIKKYFEAVYPNTLNEHQRRDITSAIHTVGHWGDTSMVLYEMDMLPKRPDVDAAKLVDEKPL